MQILIGNAYYNCSCLRYRTSEQWIVGTTIASGLLIVVVIIFIIVVVVCRRKRNKSKKRSDERAANNSFDGTGTAPAGSVELDEDDKYYSTIGVPVAEANSNANTYTRPLPAKPDQTQTDKHCSTLDSTEQRQNDDNTPYYLSLKTDDEY